MEERELSLREIQLETLKVLKKVKEICEKENIEYFLGYGTLLGAVRHKGFIPWDDDIDIIMPRKEYEKFINYCIYNKEKLGYFSLKHYRTCKEYIYPIARFCDMRYRIEYSGAKDYGLGLFVDIYPFDGINLSDNNLKRKININKFFINICGMKKYKWSKNRFKGIIKYLFFILIRKINLNSLLKKIDKLGQKYMYENTEYVNCVIWEDLEKIIPKDIFKETLKIEFEGELYKAPKKYDKFLKIHYGNYMKLPPINKQVGHHYYRVYTKINN